MIRILVTLFLLASSFSARAAEMRLVLGSAAGVAFISVQGDFKIGDDQKFIKIALPLDRAVVAFNSDGGNLMAALGIGRAIRLKEFTTMVPANSVCASACGLAWLGGSRRLLDTGAKVGFHAAYIQDNGESKETGMGNALAGAYLNQLGLTRSAIAYVTEMAPQNMKWLTPEDAKSIGIEMTLLASTETGPAVAKPESNSSLQFPGKEPLSQNLKRLPSADIFGFDFPNMPLNKTTLETCELACKSNTGCKAYTFKSHSATCYLKSNGSMVLGNPMADAGYKTEIEARLHTTQITIFERTDFQGGDYQNFSGMSFEQCIRSCEYDRPCASFTYIRRGMTCWLKSTVPAAISTKAAISGVKVSSSTDVTSKDHPQLSYCHMDWCGWFLIEEKKKMGKNNAGELFELRLLHGDSTHNPDNDPEYPDRFSKSIPIKWSAKLSVAYVFCSKTFPAFMDRSNSGIDLRVLDFAGDGIFGVDEYVAGIYVNACDGIEPASRSSADYVTRYGYQPVPKNVDVKISKETDILDITEEMANPTP